MADRRPTKAMLRVLRLMADGWTLSTSEPEPATSAYRAWLEKDGRFTDSIHGKSKQGLGARGLIEWGPFQDRGWKNPTSTAILTEKGRRLAGA